MKELFETRKSKIKGKGGFAAREIRKGQRICFLRGKKYTLEQIVARLKKNKVEGSDPLCYNTEKYIELEEKYRAINHSCAPNAYIRGKNELVALKKIKKDEEITYDYSTTMNDNKEKINQANMRLWKITCHCKSKKCRRKIDQFKTMPKNIQRYYIRHRYMPEFMLRAFK